MTNNQNQREIKFRAWDLEKKCWISDSGTTFTSEKSKEGQVALSLDGHLRVFSSSCYKPDEDEDGRITKEAIENQLHAVFNSEYERIYPMKTTPAYKRQYILMQFTGLKDKNGKEIYFGDILGTSNDGKDGFDKWTIDEIGITIVREKEKELGVDFSNWWLDEDEDSKYYQDYVEIIGNVWENPELIK